MLGRPQYSKGPGMIGVHLGRGSASSAGEFVERTCRVLKG